MVTTYYSIGGSYIFQSLEKVTIGGAYMCGAWHLHSLVARNSWNLAFYNHVSLAFINCESNL